MRGSEREVCAEEYTVGAKLSARVKSIDLTDEPPFFELVTGHELPLFQIARRVRQSGAQREHRRGLRFALEKGALFGSTSGIEILLVEILANLTDHDNEIRLREHAQSRQ